VNKYYVTDLAPGRSLVEFLVKQGFQTFVVSWRNPMPAQRDWGVDVYIQAW
jgi:poly(3-hydroxyalkanoate) synthetase